MASCKECIGYDMCFKWSGGWLTPQRAKDCPSFKNEADVVAVVRCEKCRYCAKTKEYDFCTNKHNFIDRKALLVHPKHFCGYGERK